MAVLLEDLSVIVGHEAVVQRYTGGWDQFLKDAPKSSLCTYDNLARVGFLHPKLALVFIAELENRGLVYLRGEMAQDVALVKAVLARWRLRRKT